MSRPVFHSGFADEINLYLDYKIASGYKEKSFCIILKSFDTFCFQRKINKVVFTRSDADAWAEKREKEATTYHYSRVNKVKNFLYLFAGRTAFLQVLHEEVSAYFETYPLPLRVREKIGVCSTIYPAKPVHPPD